MAYCDVVANHLTLTVCMQVIASVNGLYVLEVRLYGYDNPTGRCQGCVSLGQVGCCDRHDTMECSSFLCDTYFHYCLRSLGSQEGGECSYFGSVTSSATLDDRPIDFSQSTVLGLSNPLILPGLTNQWNVSL